MTNPDTDHIRVSDALRLVQMALEECARESNWELAGNTDFEYFARATMRPLLEYLRNKLETGFSPDIQIVKSGTFHGEIMALYPPLQALRDHYDRVRPGWRTE